ncbi:Hypothetical protein ORPV_812 [Orpheovirus IHUMI-LCC2]|uniref:Uncharacterized protein n=1 Tax=Orpheovirus IHUMI-LCC2 TaxID=2023057 RepID=A0A2I2L5B9_9VIRU|nr:Hypothetical protein ORPV_812 [Orpheovirus IHUMI-LCC2]SNW62716.1 Hypothetical protein ORPV_812 [Orpheovirus IHUMI-LCC2]
MNSDKVFLYIDINGTITNTDFKKKNKNQDDIIDECIAKNIHCKNGQFCLRMGRKNSYYDYVKKKCPKIYKKLVKEVRLSFPGTQRFVQPLIDASNYDVFPSFEKLLLYCLKQGNTKIIFRTFGKDREAIADVLSKRYGMKFVHLYGKWNDGVYNFYSNDEIINISKYLKDLDDETHVFVQDSYINKRNNDNSLQYKPSTSINVAGGVRVWNRPTFIKPAEMKHIKIERGGECMFGKLIPSCEGVKQFCFDDHKCMYTLDTNTRIFVVNTILAATDPNYYLRLMGINMEEHIES